MNDWTEIKIKIPAEYAEKAADIAQMTVPYGIYIEDYSDLEQSVMEIAKVDLIDEDLLNKNREEAIIHVYISPDENPTEAVSFLRERLGAEGIESEISTENCREQDWINNWKQYFNPLPVGKKLLILPTWRENNDTEGRLVLNIDPGLAFGTGGHETTKLCLETLERYVQTEDTLLDIGCGSGILSVAGVMLGAKSALGVDVDPVAVRTAKENVELNRLSEKIEIITGNLADSVFGTYNIIVANIIADAIISLSSVAKDFMNRESVYIMSGIIDSRLNDVLLSLEKDYEVAEVIKDNGWACIVARLK